MTAMRSSARYLYGLRGPWPQPSPRFPDEMPAAVLHVPPPEQLELSLHVVSRIRYTLAAYWPVARLYALAHPELEPVDDREFGRLLGETAFSKFLNPKLDPPDRRAFAALLKGRPSGPLYKTDFSAMDRLTPLPGIHVAPTVTLSRRAPDGRLEALAIRIGALLLRPADGDAWELAKYFVLQGAATHLVTGFHAWLHFPMDAITAITKTALPRDHVLFRLLLPHTRFSLALNDRVLEHPRTLLNNSQKEIYTPFAGTTEGTRELISVAYRGIPGNSSYPPYRFTVTPPRIHSPYGSCIDAYYETIHGFVKQVLRDVPAGDADVRLWADHISRWVPGFPDGTGIFEKGRLAAAVAFYICDVSVMHAADHHSFSGESINRLPFRLRVPPPTAGTRRQRLDRRKLVRREDIYRYKMAHQLFFKPANLTLFHRTRYRFGDARLDRLNDELLRALKKTEAGLRGCPFIPLREISRSIQY